MRIKNEIIEALEDLRMRYEGGHRTLRAGLCAQLLEVYEADENSVYTIMDSYPITQYLNPQDYTRLGPCGKFTEARYDFCGEVLYDLRTGKFDDIWKVNHESL